ncbi:BREX-1 system adenine-specific DNA-methyltransferase PglX [Chromobacterium subtsugae]|uniref:BREX-1 system adenine-specific DNA-methyltransferase PglX n=1 Tax=Chromobacterium subtsugae TaxID=251747 RepID=UPI00064129E4|nr:BREX-1 system adenine-specific DNA-methyltransferase PglX [Chromobacterium subtsugae]
MNKSALKSYASQARRDFIEMVASRANQLGILEHKGQLHVEPCTVQGDVALIAGQAFPVKVSQQRQRLVTRILQDGFRHTLEAIAYTWFNRFAALRYMEIHDYLGHGQRVLSSVTPGSLPDILSHALDLAQSGDFPGITPESVSELKLANKDGELYKRLLVAQCNVLSASMPFLFERIDDETELLLPDNLLRTDSVIRKLVDSIAEEDWQQVEVIGWLYQFYISEKKDQVIGKVVQSEDIPAATQLFTPNWIVQYLVQNSVGRLWLQANPQSALASQMAYYIQPAEQTPEVQAELDQLIQARIVEDGDTLNPESITVLDPACGSGHILVEAYELLKAIYLERGYRLRDIPRLILEKNLYGLDIDDRAAQLAGFALLMKARADDRRLLDDTPPLNVHALQESHALDQQTKAETVFHAAVQAEGGDTFGSGQLFGDGGQRDTRHSSGLQAADLRQLLDFFAQAKTFGSLLSLPAALAGKLPQLAALLTQVQQHGNALAQTYAHEIHAHYLRPAQLLAGHYDAVIANPPYMGSKGMNATVKDFAKKHFPDSKSDLFAMFIERGFCWCKASGFNSMVTMQSWMFLSSYESMREELLGTRTISSFVQVGYNSFPEINSKIAQACAFCIQATYFHSFSGRYINLNSAPQSADKELIFITRMPDLVYDVNQDDFKKIPGSPVAYWLSSTGVTAFSFKKLDEIGITRRGLQTGHKDRFIRHWFECNAENIELKYLPRNIAIDSKKKWFMFNNGGDSRRWYGNLDLVVNWENNGNDIKSFDGSIVPSEDLYFKNAICWPRLTSGGISFRTHPEGVIPGDLSPCYYSENLNLAIGVLNSNCTNYFLRAINPTVTSPVGDIAKLPMPTIDANQEIHVEKIVEQLIQIYKIDWNSQECSWDFSDLNLTKTHHSKIRKYWKDHQSNYFASVQKTKELEEENNRLFIEAYGLQDELSPEVPEELITLTRADREKDMQRLLSYAIGCVMGRYSLDEPGLIYAHAGNVGFDPSRYETFPADTDGIVPVSDLSWFPDDATARVLEFLVAVWGEETLAENLAWLAESLGLKGDEAPEETLRRYISGSFFKDHLQTYKKRPIYWLFSSGKQKAFEALVYLHRYNEGTLARMRAEYVVPLTGKMNERIKLLEDDASKAPTAAARKKIDKELDKLKKKLEELRAYDEKLRHFADQRITLDLDDGVKVNYGKFGDLLEGVKAITGGSGDES